MERMDTCTAWALSGTAPSSVKAKLAVARARDAKRAYASIAEMVRVGDLVQCLFQVVMAVEYLDR